jgi:integrase
LNQQFGDFFRDDRSRVDLVRKLITIPKSKNGNTRHVPLNSISLAAFKELFARSSGQGQSFFLLIFKGSRLAMAGVDLRTVAELMGQKTIQMTMRYAHLAPAHKLAAVERLAGSTN